MNKTPCVLGFPRRAIDTNSYSGDGADGVSRRSYTVGLMLIVLLLGSAACLLALLLHKKDRR